MEGRSTKDHDLATTCGCIWVWHPGPPTRTAEGRTVRYIHDEQHSVINAYICYSTRILNHADKEEFLSKIKARHPNLKADLEDLTNLVWHLVTYKTLPQQCLLLETLHESELNTEHEKNISELLSFVHSTMSPAFNSRVSPTDMLQRYAASSLDPTIPRQTAEQNSAIQRPVVANSYSMRGFDEPVEKHIDSAVLGPNIAQSEVE